MTDILLVNIHSFCNAGDAALTQVALNQLRENFPNCQITLMMNDPPSYTGEEYVVGSFLLWVKRMQKRRGLHFLWLVLNSLLPITTYRITSTPLYGFTPKEVRTTLQAYFDADIVVSNPGGYLHSAGKGLGLLIFIYTMAIALLLGKPLYLFPQSFGPFIHKRECVLTRWLFSNSRIVMVRELVSVQYLTECGIPIGRYKLLPDMAFAFNGEPTHLAQDWFYSNGIDLQSGLPLLGLTVIDWGGQSKGFHNQDTYEEAMALVLRHFVENNKGKAIIFPQCWGPDPEEDDRYPGKRVAERLQDLRDSVIFIASPLTPGLLKTVYGQLDILIGTRMHSNIFAISQGVPVIAIGYRHKTSGIARSAGFEKWVIDISELEGQLVVDRLDELWEVRSTVRSQLNKKMPELIAQARQAGSLLAADYYSLSEKILHG